MNLKKIKYFNFFVLFSGILFGFFVFASIYEGTIDETYKYAWGEKTGWINFGCDYCNVKIFDDKITGYAWSENFGWINLSPSNGGVFNDGEGNLSGYAWGENLGWIDFSGVKIDKEGKFTGKAISDVAGIINFDCDQCKVLTDWRPISVRPKTESGPLYAGHLPELSIDLQNFYLQVLSKVNEFLKQTTEKIQPIVKEKIKPIITEKIKPIITKPLEILKPKPTEFKEIVKEEIPLVFQQKWNLLTYTLKNKNLVDFTLAPLPEEFRDLAEKFHQLGKTFAEVGIERLLDIQKLKLVKLTLPGFKEVEKIPSDIVFVKSLKGLIDLNIILSVTEKGELEQKISTIAGQKLKLIIKPSEPVKSIKGYLVFKSRKLGKVYYQIPLESLTANLIFATPVLAEPYNQPIEEKLVLKEFEYTDPDGDGVYSAEIEVPRAVGEYEIITLIDYDDPKLGKRAIRLTAVVDPEGYVYEKVGNNELRISGAIVSLYWLNPETKKYELWPAQKYQQENPQITDVRGAYSFLVPPGFYYIEVSAPGYLSYKGKPFEVKLGSPINMKIELKSQYWWLKQIDWKVIVIILLFVLLIYNFYRDKMREIKLKESKFIQEIKNE